MTPFRKILAALTGYLLVNVLLAAIAAADSVEIRREKREKRDFSAGQAEMRSERENVLTGVKKTEK